MSKGQIIAIDGPDGSGKTTQIELLATYLREKGHDVYATQASGGTAIGKALRAVSLSDISRPAEVDLYISLAMHTAVGHDIQARAAKGQTVIVDRSPLAVVAYQVFGSQLANPEAGYKACQHLLELWGIDKLFVFEAGQDVLDARRAARTDKPGDYFERQPADFAHRVAEGYKQATSFAKKLTLPTKILTIDADQPVATIQNALQLFVA